jgi:ATPase family AAA domain-containing protein 2
LETAKKVVAKVMPLCKKRTALEEAEWEDEGEDGSFDREMLLQCKYYLFASFGPL